MGYTRPLRAELLFPDGSIRDVTNDSSLRWSSDAPSVATIDATGSTVGLLRSVNVGAVQLTATYAGPSGPLTANANITVNNATLQSLSIEPMTVRVRTASVTNFHALGAFSDGSSYDSTESVQWSMRPGWNALYGSISNAEGTRGRFQAGNSSVGADVGNAAITAFRTNGAGFTIASATASIEISAAP